MTSPTPTRCAEQRYCSPVPWASLSGNTSRRTRGEFPTDHAGREAAHSCAALARLLWRTAEAVYLPSTVEKSSFEFVCCIAAVFRLVRNSKLCPVRCFLECQKQDHNVQSVCRLICRLIPTDVRAQTDTVLKLSSINYLPLKLRFQNGLFKTDKSSFRPWPKCFRTANYVCVWECFDTIFHFARSFSNLLLHQKLPNTPYTCSQNRLDWKKVLQLNFIFQKCHLGRCSAPPS